MLGIVYLAAAILVTIAFTKRRNTERPTHTERSESQSTCGVPTVSILKPIRGNEPRLYENLASFCQQSYPDYEVIFCLHEETDPARPVLDRVLADFPDCRGAILIGTKAGVANPKIANLIKGSRAARGDIIVISDSDVAVGSDYLQSIALSFRSERVGAASSLYRGDSQGGFVGQLGAMYVEEQFAPSVLVAARLGPVRFCLGAAMAVRRTALDAIGGIEALGPFLADDHKLGELVAAHGYDVELSPYVVATTIAETTLSELFSHELRWARTNLVLAPAGYAFSFLTFAVPLTLLYITVSLNLPLGLALLALAIALRLMLHVVSLPSFGVSQDRPIWLLPLRGILSVAVWASSFFGRSVRWRKTDVSVAADGTMR